MKCILSAPPLSCSLTHGTQRPPEDPASLLMQHQCPCCWQKLCYLLVITLFVCYLVKTSTP